MIQDVRYVLNEGGRTLASQTIDVTEPEVTLTAPETTLAGATFEVSWTDAVDDNDYITIVPMGTDEGERGNYIRIHDNTQGSLRAPGSTGLYDVRYVLNEGDRTLASQTIDVTEPEVTLTAPDTIRAGDAITIRWTGAASARDYITLVPMGADEGSRENYIRVRDNSQDTLPAPDSTGLYELRYVLNEGGRILARQPIEVLDEDAPLQNGATIQAPDSAKAGTDIEVDWSTSRESTDQRITLAQEDQAIFTWISAVSIEGDAPLSITLPDSPGRYELRFLDVTNQEVLARHVIQVK